MRFARVVFLVAGVWGIVVLTPLYFLVDLTGRQYARASRLPAVLLRLFVGGDGVAAGPDMLLAVLFIVAFAVTPRQSGIFEHALRLSGLSKRMRFPQRTVTLHSER